MTDEARAREVEVRDLGAGWERESWCASYAAWGSADAGIHPAGYEGNGARVGVSRGSWNWLRDGAGEHVPPVRLPRAGSDCWGWGAAWVHGLGAGADHRFGRLPGVLPGARRSGRRGEGGGAARWGPWVGGLHRRPGAPPSLPPPPPLPVPLSPGLAGAAGEAWLPHRPGLRPVHPLPPRSGL